MTFRILSWHRCSTTGHNAAPLPALRLDFHEIAINLGTLPKDQRVMVLNSLPVFTKNLVSPGSKRINRCGLYLLVDARLNLSVACKLFGLFKYNRLSLSRFYRLPLAPDGASTLLRFNEVPSASLTIGSARIVFCTSHSLIFPCRLDVASASPLYGANSMSSSRTASPSSCLENASRRSRFCLSAFSSVSSAAFWSPLNCIARSGPIWASAM